MYYVIQVAPGTEERTERMIQGKVQRNAYERCFHLMRHVRKKFHGEWRDQHEKLLPGYVFVMSGSIKEFYMELKQVPMFTKVLGKDAEAFVTLRENEVEWLEQWISAAETNLAGRESQAEAQEGLEVGISQVDVSEQNSIVILSGPLKNMEGQIRKVNLHKRIAEVEVDFMGRKTIVYLGVEIVKNRLNKEMR